MTKEERKKAIDALKISAPIKAMTQEEFNDYIQTLNEVMDWLEQEPCDDAKPETVTEFADRCRECGAKYGKLLKQKPKSGRWIEHFDESGKWYECDQCHTDWGGSVNYCPNCGARMESEQNE